MIDLHHPLLLASFLQRKQAQEPIYARDNNSNCSLLAQGQFGISVWLCQSI